MFKNNKNSGVTIFIFREENAGVMNNVQYVSFTINIIIKSLLTIYFWRRGVN